MSISFRVVNEVWGKGASSFLDSDSILQVLEVVADSVSARYEITPYGEMMVFSVDGATAFLNYIESNPAFNAEDLADEFSDAGGVTIRPLPAAFSMADLDGDDEPLNKDNIVSLIEDMRALVPAWRKSIDEYDGLRFYVDA